MDVSTPIFEEILIYTGQAICIGSAFYMAKIGQAKLAILFLISFVLQIQSSYVIALINTDTETQGACWAAKASYYDCLPVAQRLSIHASQVGTILLGITIFLMAQALNKHDK